MDIKGCVALVTGGNRGIGEAFVRVLLESGASRVYAGSRDLEVLFHRTHGQILLRARVGGTDVDQMDAQDPPCVSAVGRLRQGSTCGPVS